MPTYLVLLQEDPTTWARFTPAQMRKVLEKYMAWGIKMRRSKRILDGHKLGEEGGRVMKKDGKGVRVVDGPFAETKDVIGGFYLFKADSYDHCLELLEDHPHLEYGHTIAVRAVDPISPDDRK
jgi:hypothetical protein